MNYNEPFQVTPDQYRALMNKCSGIVAGRVDEQGNHWCKVWRMKYKWMVEKIMQE
jgi:hypothetical protein